MTWRDVCWRPFHSSDAPGMAAAAAKLRKTSLEPVALAVLFIGKQWSAATDVRMSLR